MSDTPNTSIVPEPEIREQRIRELAYRIWEEEGCPEGRADDHWHKAAAVVEAEIAVESVSDPSWLQRENAPAPVETAPVAMREETSRPLSMNRGKRAAA